MRHSRTVVAFALALAAAACGAHGKMRVDTPVIEYRAPEISDITGVDEDSADSDAGSAADSAAKK